MLTSHMTGTPTQTESAEAAQLFSPAKNDHDIVIVGGGMVGLTLALALAQKGMTVAVIDALDPKAATDAGFDGRVSAIALASRRLFAGLGLWHRLAPDAQPINDIVVSDGTLSGGAAPLFLHFDHTEIGVEPLGHMVENRHTRAALYAAACEENRLNLIAPATATGIERSAAGVVVHHSGGSALAARLCIAADGRGSPLREQVGIKTLGWRYNQTGIVATVAHDRPHNGFAQEYFLPSGPFAILPMTGNRSSLVWTERSELAGAFLALDDAGFNREVGRRFGPYLGATTVVGPRWSYPLSLHLARAYVVPRLALVGDAAHGIHPIAGQGLNMGLRDVAALAEVVIDAARLGLDFGAMDVLQRYQRWRRFDNVLLAAVTDGLNRLFSNNVTPVRMVRDLGLAAVGGLGPARRFFMRHAGGTLGSLPRLLRGEPL